MKRKLSLAAGLGGLLLAPLAIYVALRWNDIPPPDDSDLVLPVREIDPVQNPYPSIRSFEMESENREAVGRAWDMVGGEEVPDEDFLAGLLAANSPALIQFDRYAKMADWRQDQELAIDTEVHYLNDWFAVARLKAVESHRSLLENRPGEALLAGVTILRFARGIHKAEGGFNHQLVAAAIATVGMMAILEVVESGKLSGDQLVRLDQVLSGAVFSTEIFTQSFVVEYLTHRRVADDLAEGKIHIHQLQSASDDESEPPHPPGKYFYKRNKTVKLLADSYRQFIDEASLIRSEAPEEPIVDARDFREGVGGLYFSGNLIGRILFSIVVPSGRQVSNRFAGMLVRLDLLRVRVAMERYRLDKAKWPDDLDSLVPEYLENVPVDRMNGKPIRYAKESGVIYSVGTDFVDDGGVASDKTGSLRSDQEIIIEPVPKTE